MVMLHTSQITRVVFCACFAIGGVNHVLDIVHGGLLPYDMVPMPINAYWTSLALLDFVTVGLLVLRLRLGLVCALAVMLSDVGINTYVYFFLDTEFGFIPLQLQTLFLGFLLGCFAFLWSEYKSMP